MKIILEWKGGNSTDDYAKFRRALTDKNLISSIMCELDDGDGESRHRTEHGDIIIKQQI